MENSPNTSAKTYATFWEAAIKNTVLIAISLMFRQL